MDTTTSSISGVSRRRLLQGAAGALTASLASSAGALSIQPHRFRIRMEGDVNLDWVHSLFVPPVVLPPGTVARFRMLSPAESGPPNRSRDRATTLLYVFLAPAGIPPGVAAPELFPISRGLALVESVVLSVAQFADPTTRPAKNIVIAAKYLSNDVVSPFGLLTDRAAFGAFGFEWLAPGSDAATFKLVTVGAAGSHVTVVPEAAGELSIG